MKYKVWLTCGDLSGVIKITRFKIFAYLWCILKGYAICTKHGCILNDNITIEAVN